MEIPLPADKETKNPGQQCKPKSPKDPLPEYPLDYGRLEDPKYEQTFSDEQLRLIAEWWVMCLTTNPEKRPAPTCKAQELARQEIARRQKKNGQSIDAVLSQARAYDSRLRRILSADGAEDVAGKPAMAQLERFIEELECERQGNVSAIRNGPEYYKNRLQQILVEVKAATKDYLEMSYNQRKIRIQSKINDKLSDIEHLNKNLGDFSDWLARIGGGAETINYLSVTLKAVDKGLGVLSKILKVPGAALPLQDRR